MHDVTANGTGRRSDSRSRRTAILFEVKDPRVKGVTVIGCEVSGDLRNAKVKVSIMGTDAERKLSHAWIDFVSWVFTTQNRGEA